MALPPASPNPQSSRIDRRFDTLRGKVSQEAEAAQQRAGQDLQRKAAAQGMGGSGVFMKIGQQQQKELGAQKQSALNDVESQREAAIGQAEEIQAQRDFAKAEREASQGFAAEQAQKDRAFQSSEAAVARGFNRELFDKEMSFKQKVQSDANKQFKSQMSLAMKQFGLDKEVSRFNMDMATKQFNKPELMDVMWRSVGRDPKSGKLAPGWKTGNTGPGGEGGTQVGPGGMGQGIGGPF